ncbi:hypothetical protein [Actinacidiphila epipremni]|uniref:DUF4232 domain-containing protein n=1 Tax=Actinacidiphila epipremni TaxID=2053013 RepID=A0ABX0ZK19_9ACTN|nr:hypothetical protein [Actinacidiphila epipremni]NJP42807.1 hypothetical protein [Actinacidiphila epipremni]
MTSPDARDNSPHTPHPGSTPAPSPTPTPMNPHSSPAATEPADRTGAPSPADGAEAAQPATGAGTGDPAEPAQPAEPSLPAGHAGTAGSGEAPTPADRTGTARTAGPAAYAELDESAQEEALRDLFHAAVSGLSPAPEALDQLRRAVPARRQHRRQALAGSVAALLLFGAAVPALVHAANTRGSAAAAPAGMAGTHAAHPDEDGRMDSWGATGDPGQDRDGQDDDGSGQHSAAQGGDDPSALPTSPGVLPPQAAPACSSSQLGRGSSNAGVPDGAGRVYGWFRVANVSASPCAVPPGPGTVDVIAEGPADPSQISVVNHTAGDPASGLPTPPDDEPLILAPGQTYEVAFAWVPAATGPGGCPPPTTPPTTPSATPTPTDTGVPAPGGTSAAENPMAPDSPPGGPPGGPSSGTVQPAAISLTHTPAAGAPLIVGPTLQGACAGTVYTTSPIPADPMTAGSTS